MPSDAAWWSGDVARTPQPVTERVNRTCVYLDTDGGRLAADLYQPAGVAGPRPTLVSFTPYIRGMDYRFPGVDRLLARLGLADTLWGEIFARYGYAFAHVELPGCGASFGQRLSIFYEQCQRAGVDVLDWITAQPWSDGTVGATGISALGLTSMYLAATGHPALKAIAPRFTAFDIYNSVHAGGLVQNRFTQDIGDVMHGLDNNRVYESFTSPVLRMVGRALIKGVRGVDDDPGGRLLAAAVRDHASNEEFARDLAAVRARDDQLPFSPRQATAETQSPFMLLDDLRAAGIPIYAYGGWIDGYFQREMINLHRNVTNPGSRLTLGPWPHSGRWYASPVVTDRREAEFGQAAELVRFFDLHLRGIDRGVAGEEPVHYFTMGEERWKSAPAWPPPGTRNVTLHLGPAHQLAYLPPETAGADAYRVDFTATTGEWSRHGKHLSGGKNSVQYPDRVAADAKLLCYETDSLDRDTEVTGHPIVTVTVSCDLEDAAVIAYLEDVDAEGTPRIVSDGGLRLNHRRIGDDPPYLTEVWRPGRRADQEPLVPSTPVTVTFDLLPTSWLFRAGHRIRLAIAGADADNFAAVPDDGRTPVLTFAYGPGVEAHINLPVMPT